MYARVREQQLAERDGYCDAPTPCPIRTSGVEALSQGRHRVTPGSPPSNDGLNIDWSTMPASIRRRPRPAKDCRPPGWSAGVIHGSAVPRTGQQCQDQRGKLRTEMLPAETPRPRGQQEQREHGAARFMSQRPQRGAAHARSFHCRVHAAAMFAFGLGVPARELSVTSVPTARLVVGQSRITSPAFLAGG